MEDYNIGKLINKIRIEKNTEQDKLCYGLCSVTTLLRIEKSSKNTDLMLVNVLLERMGIHSEKFMYILDEDDFYMYEKSVYIKKYVKEKKYNLALKELKKYEKKIKTYKALYYQFVYKYHAIIQKNLGNINEARNLLKKSLECTVPNFEEINLGKYYLSSHEIDIMLEYIDIVSSNNEAVDIKKFLFSLYKIMNHTNVFELSKNRMYPKVCYLCGKLFYEEGNYELSKGITKRALEALALTCDLNFRADIIYLNTLSKLKLEPNKNHIDALLDSYYLAEFLGQGMLANQIVDTVREVYKWENIDGVPLLN